MAEAVGLALSVLPIVIWALEKYSEPFEAYSDYHNAISTLQANLQIQRMHLEASFQSIGLRHPTPRELHECLRQKFPQNHNELLFIIRQMDDLMVRLMENLQVDISRKVMIYPYTAITNSFSFPSFIVITSLTLLSRSASGIIHVYTNTYSLPSHSGRTSLPKEPHGNGAASSAASAQKSATGSSTTCATGTTT